MVEEINKYIKFMKEKHGDQKRKDGKPYYEHPLKVCEMIMEKGYPLDYQIVALFHDLLENTNTTYDEIENLTNSNIANAVKLLTKEYGYDMENYISRILINDITRVVKVADRINNLRECLVLDDGFITRYVVESEEYISILAEGTVFEYEFNEALSNAKKKAGIISK